MNETRAGASPAASGIFTRILQRFSIAGDIIELSADTLSYGMGKAGEGIAALVLIPVLTRALTPIEFGVWDVTMTFFMLTTMVASLGLEPALAAFYFETREPGRKKLIASTSILFRFLFS
ncbi:MAG: oligosaccharide flippase family protein, partial [Candidatus Abyssubacteria bacterium]|nr:oligosaccharide flippase family protein [Candidatus Abyssubacteria bacterium]